MAAGDRIEVKGLRIMGTHGDLPEERERPQPFEVDLEMELDLGPAGQSDRLADTVDYGAVVERAAAVVSGRRHALLEALAEGIAGAVLVDARVSAVTVALRKLRPPVAADLAWAGVRLTRTSGASGTASPPPG